MIDRSENQKEFFNKDNNLCSKMLLDENSRKYVNLYKKLEDNFIPEDRDFLDLLRSMLVIDPFKRISCKEALNHKFFKDEFY
jgi:serine/threonine protein kinase